ncbi:MAG: restriction endonuclease subunit S [Flavobacteriaceae bacterium]|jgi:type I restriction enzyme S subunit|nr:restriction endonuclease subunit S [Flavobacteriaceae bacterium]
MENSNWNEVKLGRFIKVKHGFAFPGSHISDQETDQILVTPGNFHIGGGFKNSKFKYYNSNDYPESYILKAGDIVVTMTDLSKESDTLGYGAKIPRNNTAKFLHNQRVGLVEFKEDNEIYNDFVYWVLRTRNYQGYIVGSASGTSIMHTSPSRIEDYDFFLPPLPEQKAIASILSSLDDKIDLLNQQNKTLEALAETLFRQWFIEEAKEDWEEVPLSSIANFLNGLACQKYPAKDSINRLPVLKIKELTAGITENSDWATTDVKPEYRVMNGDVIFAWSASLMVKIWSGEDCILNQHLFKVTSEKYPKWFYYFWCKQHLREFISIAQSHATTMGHIKRSDLDEAMVLIPQKEEIDKITIQMSPILEKIQLNNNQINSLSKLRDTLLPKLMSGEVRVKM